MKKLSANFWMIFIALWVFLFLDIMMDIGITNYLFFGGVRINVESLIGTSLVFAIIFLVYYFSRKNKEVLIANKKHIILSFFLITYLMLLMLFNGDITSSLAFTSIVVIIFYLIFNKITETKLENEKQKESITENLGKSISKSILSISSGKFNLLSKSSVLYIASFFIITFFLGKFNPNNNSSTDCNGPGNEQCIDNVRVRYTNTGKTILGEKYLGNGIFGISFMDNQNPGAFTATIKTDCNCNIINAQVSSF